VEVKTALLAYLLIAKEPLELEWAGKRRPWDHPILAQQIDHGITQYWLK